MHNSNVNTSKSKQQPNAQPCGATFDSVPVEPDAPSNPLNWEWSFFSAESYEKGSTLRMAVEQLDDAFKTISAIKAISQILIANGCEDANPDDGQPLGAALSHDLNIGLHQLAKYLHGNLDGLEGCLDRRRTLEQEQERVKLSRRGDGGRRHV